MNATSFTISSSSSSSPSTFLRFFPLQISSYLRSPRRYHNNSRPRKKSSSSDQQLNLVIDVEEIRNRASNSLQRFYSNAETKLNRFIYSGKEAFHDFKTLVTVDNNQRLIISCRRSSLWFLANSLLWGFVIFAVFRFIIVKFGFLRYYHGGFGFGNGGFVSKRDRSLGGKEVVVGKMGFKEREGKKKKKKSFNFKVPFNPLSPPKEMARMENNGDLRSRKWISREEELPKWWPESVPSWPSSSSSKNSQELQKEANRVIRAIMNDRMCGKDMTKDDILQFRQICKASGARVHIETTNARDSFYRASVDFVLNSCSSVSSAAVALIDGEDARQFVAGIADSIGLQKFHAARIVSAAVAARTRSWFLQAWALEMQGKRGEALKELSKICLIHQIFSPNDSSPEMEMVAHGLEQHLRVEQRKHLLELFVDGCGPPSRSVVEALGLLTKPSVGGDTRLLTP